MSNLLKVIRKSPTPRDGSIISGRVTGFLKLRLNIVEQTTIHGKLSSIIPSPSLKKFLNRYSIKRLYKYLRSSGNIRKDWLINLESAFPRHYTLMKRQIREYIIIPGSMIKGFSHLRLELMAKPDSKGRVMSCSRLYTWSGREALPSEKGYVHRQIFTSAKRFRPPCKGPRVCLICDIFGAPGLASRIAFTDLYLIPGNVTISEVCNRKCEVALLGTVFERWLIFEYLLPEELGLILLALGINKLNESKRVLLGRYRYQCLQTATVSFYVRDLEFIDILSDENFRDYGLEFVNLSIHRALSTYANYFDFNIDEVALRAEAIKKLGKL